MSLNIKSEEAHDLARQLSRMTGESMTKIVTDALRERMARERERNLREVDRKTSEVLELVRSLTKDLKPDPGSHSLDHGELLYDENGLPK